MQLNIEVKMRLSGSRYVCFRHAVKRALEDQEIVLECDEYGTGQDMRRTGCVDCAAERRHGG